MKIYGPYECKDKRKRVYIKYADGKVCTKLYARHLLELHIGRELSGTETVDHINGDYSDDCLENLQILSLGDNIRKSTKPGKLLEFVCPQCGKLFQKLQHAYKRDQLYQGKSGPYCSKSCAGRASREKIINPSRTRLVLGGGSNPPGGTK